MSISNSQDFFIQWHLTERCNLMCKHCYQEGKRIEEISFDEVRDVMDEVASLVDEWSGAYGIDFSRSFNVTGGEPFLREDLFDILGEMRMRGFDVYLLTNGTFITQKKAKILSELGVKGVQVSIEGPENVHDMIRGSGSFALSKKGTAYLLDSDLRVTLNVTLSKLNAGYMEDIVALADELGAQRVGFSRLVPSGSGMGMLHEMLSPQEVRGLYETIPLMGNSGVEIVTGVPVASQMNHNSNQDMRYIPCGGCSAGMSGLTFLPDGTITPCRRLNGPIGNLRRDSLREIWATSEVLNLLRDKSKYKGRCRNCEKWAACRGCRAIAYAYSLSRGECDFLAEDPQCFLGEGKA